MSMYITDHLNTIFPNEDGGWGLHIEGHSTMFCTTLSYICMRILGKGPDGGENNACARARKWMLDHGSVTAIPSWGKTWLSILGVFEWLGTNPMPPEDLYYPYPFVQDLRLDILYICIEPLLTRWPFNKLKNKALEVIMKHIHYEDENSRYITIGCVEKGCGSQTWDASFAIQALLACEMNDEISDTLRKGYAFIRASQVKDNPSGDFKGMYRHISKGSRPFPDQDQGWQVSDFTAEGLTCCLVFSTMPAELVGAAMDPEQLYDSSQNGGLAAWEPAGASEYLGLLNPTEFFEDIVIEHEYVECTGSAIQALVHFKKLYPGHRTTEIDNFIDNAVKYVEDVQKPDGSWYGNWSVCFIYASWFALGGLAAAGKSYSNCAAVRKGVEFLLRTQRSDGGWGESCRSCPDKRNRNRSLKSVQTTWALMGLIHSGQEIVGVFLKNCMLHFAAFRNIFPLWGLAEYRKNVLLPLEDN
ncbi:unnamed protein product [Withania somnifera]